MVATIPRLRPPSLRVSEDFLQFKLVAGIFNRLVEMLRETIERIRSQERQIMGLCVDGAGMPRKAFIDSFPENETNLDWIDNQMAGSLTGSSVSPMLMARYVALNADCKRSSAPTC